MMLTLAANLTFLFVCMFVCLFSDVNIDELAAGNLSTQAVVAVGIRASVVEGFFATSIQMGFNL